MPKIQNTVLCAFLSSIPMIFWQSRVNFAVTEPYLDEVFHVRQAQTYCRGHFTEWDPKITTPPGLYILSYFVYLVTGSCDLFALRAINLLPGCSVLCYLLLQEARKERSGFQIKLSDTGQNAAHKSANNYDFHTAVNISLFPPLFFFTGLYYTDAWSVQVVLLHNFLIRRRIHDGGVSALLILLTGMSALLLRQTNLFWVAVFPGALTAVEKLKRETRIAKHKSGLSTSSLVEIMQRSYYDGIIYDLHVQDAQLEDFLKVAISIAVTAVTRLKDVIIATTYYLMICAVFVICVLWNGGVVLGDKSNHIVTLHLPQMIYIWPYIVFFSFPLLLPFILGYISGFLPANAMSSISYRFSKTGDPDDCLTPRFQVLLLFVAASIVIIHYNMIVHPFTLADNRHYVFYVFRILRWHPFVKYFAASLSVVCANLCIIALGGISRNGYTCIKTRTKTEPTVVLDKKLIREQDGQYVSFVIIWLMATALSVISAPLVEPRYFILPWIFWRLSVTSRSRIMLSQKIGSDKEKMIRIDQTKWSNQFTLWLETGWYLAVNTVTGYVFLYCGFEWIQEAGAVQRFMW